MRRLKCDVTRPMLSKILHDLIHIDLSHCLEVSNDIVTRETNINELKEDSN